MATNYWKGMPGAKWSQGMAWSLMHSPAPGEDAVLDGGFSNFNCPLDISSTTVLGSFTINSNYGGSFDLGGNTLLCAGNVSISTGSLGPQILNGTINTLSPCTVAFPVAGSGAPINSQLLILQCNGDTTLDLAHANVTLLRLLLSSGNIYTFAPSVSSVNMVTVVAADWNGTRWVSALPGTPYIVSVFNALAVIGMNVADCHNGGTVIDATDLTNIDGHGNTGWTFAAVPPAPSGGSAEGRPVAVCLGVRV